MILTLIGLILSFGGSFYFAFDTLINFGKPKSFQIIEYPDDEQRRRVYRYDQTKKGLKEVKISKEEKKLFVFLVLLGLGFLLQLLDFFF